MGARGKGVVTGTYAYYMYLTQKYFEDVSGIDYDTLSRAVEVGSGQTWDRVLNVLFYKEYQPKKRNLGIDVKEIQSINEWSLKAIITDNNNLINGEYEVYYSTEHGYDENETVLFAF